MGADEALNLDWCKRPFLRQPHFPLLGQFEAGAEGAGPGRAPAQRLPRFVLGLVRRRRQQLIERRAIRCFGQTLQDFVARFGDGMQIKRPRPIHPHGVQIRCALIEQPQAGPEEFHRVKHRHGLERDAKDLRPSTDEAVAPALRPPLQPGGEGLGRL